MAQWNIYDRNGAAKAITKELELHDEWMAECFITVSVKSHEPIEFGVGDYIDYRGERYTIQYDPTELKKASSGSYGEGFVYDNIRFMSAQDEIVRCDFNDIVLNDNDVHYTSLPTFPFYCETVDDLLDRVQANLEELYPGMWTIICLDYTRTAQRGLAVGRTQEFINAYNRYIGQGTYSYEKTGVAETADNINCWDALKKVHDDFALNFIIRGRVVIVGSAGAYAATNFRYGKGNGLYEIERIGDSSQQIITRLRAYGSETNLPSRYYANLNMHVYGYATETSSTGLVDIDVDFRKDYFTNEFSSGETHVVAKIGNTTYSGALAFIDGLTGKIRLNLSAEVSVSSGTKIYLTSGVNKDKWPDNRREYDTTNLPDNMAVSRLMLPGFPNQSLHDWVEAHRSLSGYEWLQDAVDSGYTFSTDKYRPYIDSPNISVYGTRPASIYFDGSNDTEDIHPTIEGTGVDVVYSAEHITDNGIYDSGEVPNFSIVLPNLGFDLSEVWVEGASIDMKDGMCGARSFEIAARPTQNESNRWVCRVKRSHDDTLDLWFPYNDFNIADGDHYVLTGIYMPAAYVDINAVRLLKASIEALSKNHAPRFTFQPRIDEIFMARQHDTASASGGSIASLHDTLKAGDIFPFSDTDMGIDEAIIIDILTIKENGNKGIPTYDVTLRDEKQVTTIQKIQNKIASVVGGDGYGLTRAQINSMIELYGSEHFISKLHDDFAEGFIEFLKGFQVGGRFTTGLLGEGGVFRKDADGTTYIEADKLYIRLKAIFDTIEVREYIHSGGNRVASPADCRVIRVEWIDSNGNVLEQTDANLSNAVKFRCYFRGSDGERTITNDFVVGDQAYCHITNMVSSDSLYQHHYWRLIIGKDAEVNENGEHYIDLSNANSNTISGVSYAGYQTGSDVPVPQDSIVQLGNVNDNTRRGAIVEFVSGADSPSYQIFQNLGKPVGTSIAQKRNSQYSFTDKNFIGIGYSTQTGRAYMNVFGDAYIGDPNGSTYIEYKQVGQGGVPELNIKANVTFTSPETHQDTTLEDFASAVVGDLESLQEQIDGSIESWFYDHVPTLQNTPASEWTTTDDKLRHLGDLFYNTTTGYGYRFANTGTQANPVFEWLRITDTDVVKALADAAKAQDTADHKRRVFVVQPTPPYDAGDLWVNATYPSGNTETDESQHKYYNDVLRCGTSKDDSGSFAIADWSLASKYTDDSALENFLLNTYAPDKLDLQQQIDGKAETWHQSTNPAAAWTTTDEKAAHVGDLWYCTVDISGTDFKKDTTWYYADKGANANPRYVWEKQDVPEEVFDKIDGKSSIYTNAVSSPPADYKKNDLWILPADATINNISYKQGDVLTTSSDSATYNPSHWSKKVRYTDDTEVLRIINSYGSILGVTADSDDVGEALGFLREVLGGKTSVDGGLILSEMIALKDGNQVMSGMNGKVRASLGLLTPAAWYGGEMVDKETLTDAQIAQGWNTRHWARALFRFDGSGYVADGGISWDKNGLTKAVLSSIDTDTIFIGGSAGATQNWVSQNFISVSFFNRLFQAYNGNAVVNANDTTSTIDSIKAMFGFCTEQYLSCLGHGSGGGGGSVTALSDLVDVLLTSPTNGQALVYNGTKWVNQTISGGGVDMAAVWSALNDATSEQINASHLTNALSGYATSSDLTGYLPLSAGSSKPLTGSLYFSGNSGINWGTSTGMLACAPSSGWTGISSTQWGVGTTSYQGVIRTNNNDILHYKSGTTYKVWDESNLDISGYLPLSAGSTKALTGQLYWDRSDTTYRIVAYDTNRATRYVISQEYSVDSTTNIMTADMTLNSYAHIITTFVPANTVGYQRLTLGNTNKLNAANNMYGRVRMAGQRDPNNASASVYFGDIVPDVLTATRTWTMPDKTGTVALVDDVSGAFTSLTSTNDTNLSVTIGGTTKSVADLYAYQSKNVRPRSMAAGDDYDTLSNYTLTRGCFVAMNNNDLTTNDVTLDDLGTYDTLVSFGYNLRTIQFKGNAYGTMRLKYRRVYQPSTGVFAFSPWKEITFADGNIATATALATARTLWGHSFDGTDDVSGNMTDVGTITGNGNITVTKTTTADTIISVTNSNGTVRLYTSSNRGLYDGTSGSTGWIIATNGTNTWMSRGNVGIGTTTPSYKLHVSGVSAAQSFRSTVETGTAPLVVASSTLVTNLNADRLDGYHASDFATASDVTTLQGYFDSSGAALTAVQLKTTRTLWGQNFNGTSNVTGDMTSVGSITLTNNSRISNATGSGGSLYIGRSDDAGWVKMSDMCSRQGDSYWKIKSNGDITAANIYSNGDLSCLSDARKKTVIGHLTLDVRRIAEMPIVRFLWKDRSDNSLQVGTLAQSWLSLLPEIVTHSKEDVYGVKYGVGAMCIGVSNSREIVNILNEIAGILNEVKSHDKRLTLLEMENRELREEINRIKAA
jgi:hypothetical protein